MNWIENLLRDVRLGAASLARSPGFAAVAVLSLAVGIGAGTAVFSLVQAILLRSLPVPNPQELRILQWSGTDVRVRSFDGNSRQDGNGRIAAEAVSHPAFLSLRAQGAAQADVFGFYPLHDAAVVAAGQAFVADGAMVSANFFSALQVRPQAGRLLTPGEDYEGGGMNVVIGHDFWQRRFGLDPGVLGRSVALNGRAFTVVGVLEPGFNGLQPGQASDFYVPMSGVSPFLYTSITADWHWFVRTMARLRAGATDTGLAAALDVAFAGETAAVLKRPKILVEPGHAGLANDREHYRKPLLLMLSAVGLVLLVACANLAGLLLARGAARRHEVAVRAALGAGRWRLFQQSLAESLTIALLGGGLGVLLAAWAQPTLVGLLAVDADGLRYDFSLNLPVLAFSLAVSLAAALLAGVLPSIRCGRTDPMNALRGRGSLVGLRLRAGRILVVAQVGLSLLVLTSAGLFVRTLANLARVDAGFSLERLLLVGLNLRGGEYADTNPVQFYERALEAVAAVPGVKGSAVVEFPLLGPGGSSGSFNAFVDGPPAPAGMMQVRRLRVSESFFTTMGVPILRGRALSGADSAEAAKAVVVNEAFIRNYLPDRDPIGVAFATWDAAWTIVGVCRDAKYTDIKEPVSPTAYFSYRQMFYSRFARTHLRTASIAARTALSPLALASEVRQAVARVDPGVAVTMVTTQEEVRDRSIARERLLAIFGGGLAGLALLLSCVGLFGLMAHSVTRRTGEIGLRMALGATRPDVVRSILREALLLAAAGAAVGLPLALALTRLVTSQLFGVKPGDPLSMALALVAVLATAAGAAWIPAWRAQRIEPIEALRYDG
ncbi:MAG TPA: ABC transporter permease [Vicinamibacterales bacterium]|jgi:predicted permease